MNKRLAVLTLLFILLSLFLTGCIGEDTSYLGVDLKGKAFNDFIPDEVIYEVRLFLKLLVVIFMLVFLIDMGGSIGDTYPAVHRIIVVFLVIMAVITVPYMWEWTTEIGQWFWPDDYNMEKIDEIMKWSEILPSGDENPWTKRAAISATSYKAEMHALYQRIVIRILLVFSLILMGVKRRFELIILFLIVLVLWASTPAWEWSNIQELAKDIPANPVEATVENYNLQYIGSLMGPSLLTYGILPGLASVLSVYFLVTRGGQSKTGSDVRNRLEVAVAGIASAFLAAANFARESGTWTSSGDGDGLNGHQPEGEPVDPDEGPGSSGDEGDSGLPTREEGAGGDSDAEDGLPVPPEDPTDEESELPQPDNRGDNIVVNATGQQPSTDGEDGSEGGGLPSPDDEGLASTSDSELPEPAEGEISAQESQDGGDFDESDDVTGGSVSAEQQGGGLPEPPEDSDSRQQDLSDTSQREEEAEIDTGGGGLPAPQQDQSSDFTPGEGYSSEAPEDVDQGGQPVDGTTEGNLPEPPQSQVPERDDRILPNVTPLPFDPGQPESGDEGLPAPTNVNVQSSESTGDIFTDQSTTVAERHVKKYLEANKGLPEPDGPPPPSSSNLELFEEDPTAVQHEQMGKRLPSIEDAPGDESEGSEQ